MSTVLILVGVVMGTIIATCFCVLVKAAWDNTFEYLDSMYEDDTDE